MKDPTNSEPSGFDIGSWGMEYFGGTISGLGPLLHEVFHMYFGCSLVANTYRDSWWDEAINMWYGHPYQGVVEIFNAKPCWIF